jgi:hypothetical protein
VTTGKDKEFAIALGGTSSDDLLTLFLAEIRGESVDGGDGTDTLQLAYGSYDALGSRAAKPIEVAKYPGCLR